MAQRCKKQGKANKSFTVAGGLAHAFVIVGKVVPLVTPKHSEDTALPHTLAALIWGLDANDEPVCLVDKAKYYSQCSICRYQLCAIHLLFWQNQYKSATYNPYQSPHCLKEDNQEAIMAGEKRAVKILQSYLHYLLIAESVTLGIYLDSLSLFPYLQFKMLILILHNCHDHY